MSSKTDGFPDYTSLMLSQLEEIRRTLARDRENASESRRRVYEQLGEVTKGVHEIAVEQAAMKQRMAMMEETYAAATPTLSEFTKVKHWIDGAGLFGGILWKIGAALLAAAYTLYVWRADLWAALGRMLAK